MISKVLFILLIIPGIYFAQVGINTQTPSRKLHISGNTRVRQLINKSETSAYDRLLVSDQNGNIDYTTKASMQPSAEPDLSNKESYSLIYNRATGSGDPLKTLKCGKFLFLFENTLESRVNFRLFENPGSTINIYMSMEQNFTTDGYQFYQGKAPTNAATVPFTFTTTNWNVNQEFASANLADYEQNIMHFQYPNDTDFYRLTIYRVKQNTGTDSWDFAAVCEKY
ncbi:hypothetical protein [Chryseobacterium mulctrae]|uniref:hypothetical protein n=1 Tax=Chryseobacterium mulctrae TaxID=2576777 RepID=UPI0011169512|nr:hypothetical protein [Chryseobacterium mulctrae]